MYRIILLAFDCYLSAEEFKFLPLDQSLSHLNPVYHIIFPSVSRSVLRYFNRSFVVFLVSSMRSVCDI